MNSMEMEEEAKPIVELSINFVVGLSYPGTMKVKGKIKGEEVTILIDCGATTTSYSRR